ncbi:MAG: PEP-CTERM sorting domain-containing protein [Deltaproteobacteria bacterium]|nr:PEP-CTERM sorting domain-containing protein [Deltaproteobacteria bacterium]
MLLNLNQEYDFAIWSLSSDADAVGANSPNTGYPGVANNVTAWQWNYELGTGSVKFSTNGVIVPADNSLIIVNQQNPLPAPGVVGLGWIDPGVAGFRIGTGIPSVVGTVTIAANALGVFAGGAILIPDVDGFGRSGVLDGTTTFSPASFTVTPEPGTALLLGIGLVGLAAGQRRLK